MLGRQTKGKVAQNRLPARTLGARWAHVFNELAYGFCREDLNQANEIFSRILLVV